LVTFQDPPGFVAATELRQAAWDNGYRVEHAAAGAWLSYQSTTARGQVWLAAEGDRGPWWVAIDHPGIAAEFGPARAAAAPGLAVYRCANREALYAALDRIYRLGVSLPDMPLAMFQQEIGSLPRTTEAERTVIQRIGQNVFRQALMAFWNGACAVTGIADPALLRASHVIPWAECATDAQRLDVHNGLLLSALWDAAFDAGLVSFDDLGTALFNDSLSVAARKSLGGSRLLRPPTAAQQEYLRVHRMRERLPET
jgi:hypothetical protein